MPGRKTPKKVDKITKPMIIKDDKGAVLGEYSPKLLNVIKKTVAKGATNEELYMFLNIASMYGLNPFTKDIWFVKVKTGDNMIMTSRDGYLKIAKRDPNFAKVQSYAVYENDKFETVIKNGEVKEVNHSFTIDRGAIVGAYAFLRTKDGESDLYAYKKFSDYVKKSPVWRDYKEAMIRKVAEVDVLKRFANIDGLVTYEEMGHNPKDIDVEYQYTDPENINEDSEILDVELTEEDKENIKKVLNNNEEGDE